MSETPKKVVRRGDALLNLRVPTIFVGFASAVLDSRDVRG